MSSRTGSVLAVILLLVGMGFRLFNLSTNPPGFHPDEVNNIRISETVRQGRVEVFYDLGAEGREGLYQMVMTLVTGAVGGGLVGYRLVSVWVGLLTLAAIYALVKHLYTPLAAVAAMALLSVSMLPVLLSRTISRESLLPLLLTFVMLSLAHGFAIPRGSLRRPPSTTPFTALGILLGIGFYIHPQHYIIALVTLLFIAFMIIRRPMSRRSLSYIAYAILIMIVLAIPYMLSAIRLPELAGANRVFTDISIDPRSIVDTIISGLGGLFLIGDHNPIYNLPGRPLIDLVSALLMIVGVLVAVRHIHRVRYTLPLVASVVLLPFAILSQSSPSFRAMIVLLPLIALFFGVGVSAIYHGVHRRARLPLALLLLVLFAANIVWTGRDLFLRWPQLEAVQTAYRGEIAETASYLDRTAGSLPTVLCVGTINPNVSPELANYELLALMMHRQNVPLRYADCGSGMIFTNGGERQQIVFLENQHLGDLHSYVQDWLRQGELQQSQNVPPDSVIIVDAEERLANTIGRFMSTVPVTFAPESPGGQEAVQPPVRFGGNVAFLGYEPLSDEAFHPGDYVTVIAYWRIDGIVPTDLRLFTHVLLDPAVVAAQRDTLTVLPASLRPRDVVMQISFVRLPDVMPEGDFRVSIGAYESNTGTRLATFDGETARGSRLFLDTIHVINR